MLVVSTLLTMSAMLAISAVLDIVRDHAEFKTHVFQLHHVIYFFNLHRKN